jgi:SAM-dependent MidA family methyltransferase
MNFDNTDDIQNIKYQHRGIKEILKSLLETPIGIHQIFVYPNIEMLREIYFHYIKKLLDNNNEIIIFLPYYETAESVKKVLSSFSIEYNNNNNIEQNKYKDKKDTTVIEDINRYINNGSLVIIDSEKAFSNVHELETKTNGQSDKDNVITQANSSNTNSNNNFLSLLRMSMSQINKLRKEGITIIADYGFMYNNNNKKYKYEDLLELEKSIPYFFDNIKIRQICLYNQKDFFHKFTKQQKKEILDLHSRSIMMMD